MGHFKSNLRDIEFNLFEVLKRQDVLGAEPFAEVDDETARGILDEVNRLAEGPIAESFADADRNPPVFDPATHSVTDAGVVQALLPGLHRRRVVPPRASGRARRHGRSPHDRLVRRRARARREPGRLDVLEPRLVLARALGAWARRPRREVAEQAIEGRWGYTMVLTEPDAGSDVGAGRTKAIQQPDGTWHIEGVKRFITSAEHDMADNILHIVLARPEGAGPGTKGLSMFLVPKFAVNEDGSLGERNGVYVTNVEHKMGLKASTTCELTFGAEHPAVGTLIGDVHDGIRQMFMIIEFARMMVGTKAIAALSTGYLNALDYAKTSVQGADLTRMTGQGRSARHDHEAPRRPAQPAAAEVLRRGHARAGPVHREPAGRDPARRGQGRARRAWPTALNDLLLPMVKGVGSERGYEQLAQSLQTLGGSGYLQDYPIEQYIRDAKIDSLYEGTTAIQGMDLYFRKIVRNQGAALTYLLGAGARVRRGRQRQRPAEEGAGRAGQGRRQRRGDRRGDERLPRQQPGAGAGDLPGRPQHHQAAAGARRPDRRLAARSAGRGRAGQAGRGRPQPPATRRSTRARWRRPGSSPRPCCRAWRPSARSRRPPSLDRDGAARRRFLTYQTSAAVRSSSPRADGRAYPTALYRGSAIPAAAVRTGQISYWTAARLLVCGPLNRLMMSLCSALSR